MPAAPMTAASMNAMNFIDTTVLLLYSSPFQKPTRVAIRQQYLCIFYIARRRKMAQPQATA
jgi:hypothetical protein